MALVSSTWSYSEKSLDGMMLTPRSRWRVQLSARIFAAASRRAVSLILPDQNFSSAIFNSRRGPMRGTPNAATGTGAKEGELDIGKPRDVGAGPDMREQQRRRRRSLASDTPGHPARGRTVIAAGLLAHGSLPWVRPSRGFRLSGIDGQGSPFTVAGAASELQDRSR